MNFPASHRYARISAKKVRPTANLIRGLDVNRALNLLTVDQTRGGFLMAKVLRSAVANAGQNDAVDVNNLYIRDCRVDEGPLLNGRMRYRPASMGRSMPIRRRTSHLKIVLSEREAG
ncbi:MAG TPA: 50S ribosomal protein L22 [Planctomycetota bacterium]|jgi:large subunit ribosomal protein L22|nr:50S ribosomal protein L22 [Planctomycetota bacterium]MDP7246948.1 50S ribosomal protein L22 [Planctomycetota bacterium]MDP7559285.1 50S ribosomal protein L22 [Planctomycetota bacterium]HJM38962.1 50S ribosomal protein L22 [Planctomycetota bacterium]|tara:strand:+ start:50508 stop:50858 length:351 start_codon:yes stop_codon:yes gene_type:complete